MFRILVGSICVAICVAFGAVKVIGQDEAPPIPFPVPEAENAIDPPAWAPKKLDSLVDNESLGLAKISADQKNIRVLLPIYQWEERTGERTVTTLVTEERTRLVTRNGKEVEETFTVTVEVPVTEQFSYVTPAIAGHRQFDIEVESAAARDISGKVVATAELRRRLQNTTKLFVITVEEAENMGPEGFDPFYASIYRSETLILAVPSEKLYESPIVPYKRP